MPLIAVIGLQIRDLNESIEPVIFGVISYANHRARYGSVKVIKIGALPLISSVQ